MNIGEILEKCPQSAEVMFRFGLHCVGCKISPHESLEDGAKSHGMSDEDVDKMVEEINSIDKTKKDKKDDKE